MPFEMVDRLQRVFTALSDNRVELVLCGGVACVLQGCERTTQDLDTHVADAKQRERWVQEKGALAYTLVSPEGRFWSRVA